MYRKTFYDNYERIKAIRIPIDSELIEKCKSDLLSMGVDKIFRSNLDQENMYDIIHTWIQKKHPKLVDARYDEKQTLPYLNTSWFDDPVAPSCLDLVIEHIRSVEPDPTEYGPTEYGYSRELHDSELAQVIAIHVFDGCDLSKLRMVEFQWKTTSDPINCYSQSARLQKFMQPSSIVVPTPDSVSADILKNLDPKGLISLFGTDKFYVDSDIGSVRWVYFNPDSNAGGQFVENNLTFDQIVEVAENYPQSEFFDQLGSIARQYLIDIDTDGFAYEARDHLTAPCQVTGMSVASMTSLIEIARGSV